MPHNFICIGSERRQQLDKERHTYIDIMSRVFTTGSGDRGSIPGRVIPKTQRMVADAALLNTQYHKVRIKGKVVQFRERSSALP